MATSIGGGLTDFADHVLRLGPTFEYVAVASTTSLIIGVVVSRALSAHAPAGPACPPPPPCACFCGCADTNASSPSAPVLVTPPRLRWAPP